MIWLALAIFTLVVVVNVLFYLGRKRLTPEQRRADDRQISLDLQEW